MKRPPALAQRLVYFRCPLITLPRCILAMFFAFSEYNQVSKHVLFISCLPRLGLPSSPRPRNRLLKPPSHCRKKVCVGSIPCTAHHHMIQPKR